MRRRPCWTSPAPDAPGTEDVRLLTLPDDPVPAVDAVASIGHVISYLPDAAAIDRAFVALATALRPGGVFAVDICDLEYGEARRDDRSDGRVGEDWAIVTKFSRPLPDRFVRDIAVFVRDAAGGWHRDDERHDNVLVDTTAIPALLRAHGVDATVEDAFGREALPEGLKVIRGVRR